MVCFLHLNEAITKHREGMNIRAHYAVIRGTGSTGLENMVQSKYNNMRISLKHSIKLSSKGK